MSELVAEQMGENPDEPSLTSAALDGLINPVGGERACQP